MNYNTNKKIDKLLEEGFMGFFGGTNSSKSKDCLNNKNVVKTIGKDAESKRLLKDPNFIKLICKHTKGSDIIVNVKSSTKRFIELLRTRLEENNQKFTSEMKKKVLDRFIPFDDGEDSSYITVYDKKLKKISLSVFNKADPKSSLEDQFFEDMKEAEWKKWLGIK